MKVVIGVDSGGTHTRALAVTLNGERMGYAESGGGNPAHDAASGENVREAIRLAARDCGIGNVVRVVAGIAGYDYPDQLPRVLEATNVEGLTAEREHYNDAEVAHFAAFAGGPGIVTIQGTGSMIFAVLENGRKVKNAEFMHYARGGAVNVGIDGIHALLNQQMAWRDEELVQAAFALWEVDSLDALREALTHQRELEAKERSRRHGEFARAVTASAQKPGRLHSIGVVGKAGREIATGIRLLGSLFESEEVPVAPIGACVRSPAMRKSVERWVGAARDKRYRFCEPLHPPVVGAVLMGLRAEGVDAEKAALFV